MALRKTGKFPGTFPIYSTNQCLTTHSVKLGRARKVTGWDMLVGTTLDAWVERQSLLSDYRKHQPNATQELYCHCKLLHSCACVHHLQSCQQSCQYCTPVYRRHNHWPFYSPSQRGQELLSCLGGDVHVRQKSTWCLHAQSEHSLLWREGRTCLFSSSSLPGQDNLLCHRDRDRGLHSQVWCPFYCPTQSYSLLSRIFQNCMLTWIKTQTLCY